MGCQTRFFSTENDVVSLINVIRSNGGCLITLNNVPFDSLEEFNFLESNKSQFCIKLTDSKNIYYRKSGKIDTSSSDVIEFMLSSDPPEYIVDLSPVQCNFMKNGCMYIDDESEYRRQMSEYMKSPIYMKNPDYKNNVYECGRIWYEHKYCDENYNLVEKNRELQALYKTIKRYITKYYRISKDKLYYIGPDAYKEYKMGLFIPKTGRFNVEFE